jgi:toxin-antitoxin system PIN domain toxin
VIVPDVNLLVYAHNESAPSHSTARVWWELALAGDAPVGLPWAVVFGFIRLVTHPSVMRAPVNAAHALDLVDEWFACENVTPLEPGPRHLAIVRDLFAATGVAASLTSDTHLAALAIEHRAELHSNDHDFQRFPGLRLHDPTA